MKEDEAKTKTCPHMLLITSLSGIGMLIASPSPDIADMAEKLILNNSKCQGSDCMMWVETLKPIYNVAHQIIGEEDGGDCGLKVKS
jgi:hypothetical protein